MSSLYAGTRNEIDKLIAQTKTKLALALSVLMPIVFALALERLESGVGLSLGRDLPQLTLSLFTAIWLPLFLFMTAAESFSGEAGARTIKLVLLRPISRAKAFGSKVLALLLYAAALLLAAGVVSVVAGLVMDYRTTAAGLLDSIQAYAAAYVAMAAVGLAAVFVAQWLRSGTGALALCIFLYVAAKLLPFVYPEAAAWSVFTYTDWHTLWIGSAASAGKLLQVLAILLSSGIISYMAGWYLFEKKFY